MTAEFHTHRRRFFSSVLSLASSRGARGSLRRAGLAAIVGLAVTLATSTADAGTVLYDGFDYGSAGGSLAGLGSAGGGWAGAWDTGMFSYGGTPSYSANYEPGGLTFSDLPVSGGNAILTTNWNGGINAGRQHAASVTGDLYGSYLFQRTVNPYSSAALFAMYEGTYLTGPSNYAQFSIEPVAYASSNGGVITSQAYAYASGTAIATGQTYLVLFKVTGLSATPTTQSTTMWILNESQYDNFRPGGIDEGELNTASLGTGAAQVLQRVTKTTNGTNYQFASDRYLLLHSYYYGSQARYDELRISNSSLNAVLGIPEPASVALLALGAVGVWGVFRRVG